MENIEAKIDRNWRMDMDMEEPPPPPSGGNGDGEPQEPPKDSQKGEQGNSGANEKDSSQAKSQPQGEGQGGDGEAGEQAGAEIGREWRPGKKAEEEAEEKAIEEMVEKIEKGKPGDSEIEAKIEARDDYDQKRNDKYKQTATNATSTFKLSASERERRLANSFANIISKVAEDLVGFPIEGDDEWDIQAIMGRHLNHKNLTHCRQSRERDSVVICLDSSGSCSHQARFYGKLAEVALRYGDVEVYDAPNGRLTKKKSGANGKWEKIPGDHYEGRNGWEGINGRTVIFFGDWHPLPIVARESGRNKIYYFDCLPDDEVYHGYGYNIPKNIHDRKDCMNYSIEKGYHRHDTNDSMRARVFECYTEEDLIRLAKKIR